MKALAAYVMRGRVQAILAAAALAFMALMLMPLSWPLSFISAAVVGLLTLTRGPREGVFCMIGAMLLLGLVTLVLTGNPFTAVGFASTVWLPVLVLAVTLRLSVSLPLTLLLNAGLGMAVVIGMYLVLGDPADWWYRHITEDVLPVMEKAGVVFEDKAVLLENLRLSSTLLTGAMAAVLTLGTAAGVFLARRWQALLYNPGGFQSEFHQLRVGTVTAGMGILLLALAQFGPAAVADVSRNLVQVLMVIFLLQGLAVGHALVKRLALNTAWLVAMYVVLVFSLPYGPIFLGLAGLMDNWVNFRDRFRKPE